MTWEELQSTYPNKWVFIKDVKRNENRDIVAFELLKVCNKEEKAKWLEFYLKQPYKFECIRTTENIPNAGIWL